MSDFSKALARLRDIVDRINGPIKERRVRVKDLAQLLHHFDRLDNEVRSNAAQSVAHIEAAALRAFAAKVRDNALPGATWTESLALEADSIERDAMHEQKPPIHP